MNGLLTLDAWAAMVYATPPSRHTLRRWARDGHIFPAPQRHGRNWYVEPEARYVSHSDPQQGRLVDRVFRGKAA